MNIKINRLMLQNFKGIQYLVIYADGADLKIYGDNATGKTTVFDSFTWLLFGKDSLGRSDFGIKTQDEKGNVIHNLEHSVECELAIDNSILTLKKVYVEKWTKKRGSAEAEFSGHETKYFVNEVPTTKKEYELKISGIIDETLFKIITNPLYFNEYMKWQDRRAILLNLCENITDDDILANNEQFAPLNTELKGRTVQEYKKIIQNKQSAINDELKAIPQRIQEASLAIPETVAQFDETDKASAELKIADLNREINAIKNGLGVTDTEMELRALKEKKAQVEISACNVSDIQNERQKHRDKLFETNFEISDCERNIQNLMHSIKDSEQRADSLRKEWYEVNDKQYSESENCPTCGQPLPAEQIEQAKAKFNTDRAERLDTITANGKKAKAELENYISKHDEWAKRLETLKATKKECEDEICRAESLIADMRKAFELKKEAEIEQINLRIAEIEKKAQNSTEDLDTKIYTIQEQINVERAKIAEIDKVIAGRELAIRQKQRIADLEADEKRLAVEYSELDKMAFLIDEFIKHKVELLSEEINNHFKYAKFKLFDIQINGGIAECCEVTYKGVPYSDLNNAARISIGIDVINTLCKLNDKYAPIIVDNSESITDIPQATSQMICLIVSADDDVLRVEKN